MGLSDPRAQRGAPVMTFLYLALGLAGKRGLQKREALTLLCAYLIYATLRVIWA